LSSPLAAAPALSEGEVLPVSSVPEHPNKISDKPNAKKNCFIKDECYQMKRKNKKSQVDIHLAQFQA
jgi:hypothetical protein